MIICLGTTPTIQRTMIFDRLTIDAVNRATEVKQTASGKSINVARVLNTLGCSPIAIGFLGEPAGTYIRNQLDREQIRHDFVEVIPDTRTCTTVLDRSGKTVTELVENAAAVDPSAYEILFQKFLLLLPGAEAVVLSGSLTPNAPQDIYGKCIAEASKKNVPVVLDAKGMPLQLALPSRPMVVKPNRTELAETVEMAIDSDSSLREAIRKLIGQGPRWVVVTNGAKETIASNGESFWRISSPKIKAVNPIGSGDSFAAGLAAGIVQRQTVPEACRLAVACGAANAMTDGPGQVRVSDINALLEKIEITN